MKRICTVLLLAVCLLMMSGKLWAQATAQMSGTVQDQSGAVLPGVEVTATQTETGVTRMTISNETGFVRSAESSIGSLQVGGEPAWFPRLLFRQELSFKSARIRRSISSSKSDRFPSRLKFRPMPPWWRRAASASGRLWRPPVSWNCRSMDVTRKSCCFSAAGPCNGAVRRNEFPWQIADLERRRARHSNGVYTLTVFAMLIPTMAFLFRFHFPMRLRSSRPRSVG